MDPFALFAEEHPLAAELRARLGPEIPLDGPRLLYYEDLKPEKGVKFTRQHIGRLERAGKFPRRVRPGPHSVAWLEHEIDEWLLSLPRGGR